MSDSTLPVAEIPRYEASSPDEARAPASAARAARSARWRAWVVVLGVVVALRVAMSIALGPLVEERLSRILGARVRVGDVSFAPIDAVVTLRNVTVHRGTDPTPAIDAGRVRIDVQWLPLVHRAVVVRELALESGVIDLERLAGRDASLEHLVHVDPATELPPGWTFALDRITLRDTRLRGGEAGTGERPGLDVDVREAQVATRQRRASAFKRAPNLHVDARVDGGRIRIDGSTDVQERGIVIDASVRAKDVPIGRLQSWLPDLGWTAAGRLSGRLHYQRDPERRDLLDGWVRARGIEVRTPAIDQPAVALRKVEAEVDAIDLRNRRVAIRSLTLHGARLAMRPDLDSAIAVLDRIGRAVSAPPAAKPRPAGTAAEPTWSWALRRAETRSARVHVAGADGETVLAAGVLGENLGSRAYWSPLRAWVSGSTGAAEFDGSVRMMRGLRIDGRLTAHDVDAPAFARAIGVPMAELAQTGRGSAVLDVELEPGATDTGKLGVRGNVLVEDVWLAGTEPETFAMGARSLRFTVDGIAQAVADRDRGRPAELQIADATVTAPYVLVTRAATGWMLPTLTGEALAPGEPSMPAVAEPTTVLRLSRVRSSGGRVLIVDQTTRPQVVTDLNLGEGWARYVRLPEGTVGDFALQGAGRPFGEVRLAGAMGRSYGDIEVFARGMPLASAAPYLARAGLPYWFVDGTGAVWSRLTLAGDRWDASTTLTLREPRFGGDQAALEHTLGMPIDDALLALRDPAGDVTLELPLASPGGDRGVTYDAMVAAAFREGVARARQAPLPNAPLRVVFTDGGANLGHDAERQIAAFADLLAARPDATIELSSGIFREDRRGLAEQAAARNLTAPRGFKGMLRALGVRDQYTRIREALAARAAGEPGPLDPQDEATLRALAAEGPRIEDGRLVALAAERLRRVADALADRYGIARARIVVRDPGRDETGGSPAVQVAIGGRPRDLTTWAGAGRW